MFLDYAGIRVTDLDRSLAFYGEGLGLDEVRRGTTEGVGTWVLLQDPNSREHLELNFYPSGTRHAVPYVPGEGLDHLGFRVPNPAETAAALFRHGGRAAPEGADAPDGGLVFVLDPDGNWIELIQTTDAEAKEFLARRRARGGRGRTRKSRSP
ncbi:MAG TPA: VOC family protein [Thermoplasmata archaeon]|nr:VOC family protein [Thermoplasmata archaeon]